MLCSKSRAARRAACRRVTFTILSSNTHDSLDINKTTGVLFVARDLDRDATALYTLHVKVVDSSATSPQSNIIKIKLQVTNVNDCAFKVDASVF